MEIKETGIKRFADYEEALKALQGHFKANDIEKHPDSMINFFFRKAATKYMDNYHKARISKNHEEKIRRYVLTSFRKYYGEWVNLYDFNLKKGQFQTNFRSIYKTENGRLYGSLPGSTHDHVFYTAHCFERYRARSFCFDIYKMPILAFKRVRNMDPTAADLLKFLVLKSEEYCIANNFFYLNVRSGVVVFEILSGGLLIAKTFLAPEMDLPKIGWVHFPHAYFKMDLTDNTQKFCEEKGGDPEPIKGPTFSEEDIPYSECIEDMNRQAKWQFFDL